MEVGVRIYAMILEDALPIALAFGICEFVVSTYLGMLLRGKSRLGG